VVFDKYYTSIIHFSCTAIGVQLFLLFTLPCFVLRIWLRSHWLLYLSMYLVRHAITHFI